MRLPSSPALRLLLAALPLAAALVLFLWIRSTTGEGALRPGGGEPGASADREAAWLDGEEREEEEPVRAALPDPEPEEAPTRTAAKAPEREAAPPPEVQPPFHGRVVDVATDEPVAWTHMVTTGLESEVDGEGLFSCEGPLPPQATAVEFHDRFQRTHIRTIATADLEPEGDGWLARIAVGPTFRLWIEGVAVDELDGWRARLVELRKDGEESAGSWIRIHPRQPPFFRYDNPWEPDEEGSRFRVDVRNEIGTRRGSSRELASAVGVHPEVLYLVADEALSAIRGRVVDTLGRPKRGARVTAVPLDRILDAGRWPIEHTEPDGTFAIGDLTPGAYRLHVRPRRGEEPRERRLELSPGETDLGDFVVDAQDGAGMVEGLLKSASGAALEDEYVVRIRATDGSGFQLFDVTSQGGPRFYGYGQRYGPSRGDQGDQVFEFNEIPRGDFELSVVSRDGFAWSPATVRVEAPNDEVVFVRQDEGELVSLAFEIDSDEAPPAMRVQLHAGDAFRSGTTPVIEGEVFATLPVGTDFRWTLVADGHRPVRGDASAFVATGDRRVATVELEPGAGVRLVVRDLLQGFDLDDRGGHLAAAEHPPVAGAEVFVDGKRAGETDGGGVVDVELESEFAVIEIAAPGWVFASSSGLRDGHLVGDARDVVVWMVRY